MASIWLTTFAHGGKKMGRKSPVLNCLSDSIMLKIILRRYIEGLFTFLDYILYLESLDPSKTKVFFLENY